MSDGTRIVVQPSLKSLTTYILIEQRRWFEKEWPFVLQFVRPGMTFVDIGANVGVYSLAVARAVGLTGRVLSFEPSATARGQLLEGRALNHLTNMEVVDAAASNYVGTGALSEPTDTEFGGLAKGGSLPVRVTTLDTEFFGRNMLTVDFLKIDVEGHELAVLEGATRVLTEQSPLVMFEIGPEDRPGHSQSASYLLSLGYHLFRLLGPSSVLGPYRFGDRIDGWELNLFAAKGPRAAELEAQGLLATRVESWQRPSSGSPAVLRSTFAAHFDWGTSPRILIDALLAYDAWRDEDNGPSRRLGALAFSFHALSELCKRQPTAPRLSSLSRVAIEFGHRTRAIGALKSILDLAEQRRMFLNEPFWPPAPHFDDLSPAPDPNDWFLASVVDQFERSRFFSSRDAAEGSSLSWLLTTPYASEEMHRRHDLIGRRSSGDLGDLTAEDATDAT